MCNRNGTQLDRKSPVVLIPWHITNYKLRKAFYLGVLVCCVFLGGWVVGGQGDGHFSRSSFPKLNSSFGATFLVLLLMKMAQSSCAPWFWPCPCYTHEHCSRHAAVPYAHYMGLSLGFSPPLSSFAIWTEVRKAARRQEELDIKEDEEDEEKLQRAREWDDWKDTHPRGYGNRQNMG